MTEEKTAQEKAVCNATLVMESKGFAPAVRSAAFSGAWSKLYQADAYYLDMTLTPAGKTARLQGQLLASDGGQLPSGTVALYQGEAVVQSVPVGAAGDFYVDIGEAQQYCLSVELDDAVLRVSGLDIN